MKDTSFYWKLLLVQSVIYGLLGLVYLVDGSLSAHGKIVWIPLVSVFYSISIMMTFIIPMIQQIPKDKKD